MKQSDFSRRKFLSRCGGAAAAYSIAPKGVRAAEGSKEKLNLAIIGAGGRGWDNLQGVGSENIVALCDVDDKQAAKAFEKYPKAQRYRDYRQLLEREKSIDGVVVSTPDHMHAPICAAAIQLGRHVYCEKPLTRLIGEARHLRQLAEDARVVTQMGIQGHAMEGTRRVVEIVRAGLIGEVREVHAWSDRPAGWWEQGIDRPSDSPPVPAHLDWDLWLGVAPVRPYHPAYVPFKWRGFWDFGTGAIGDMGIHNMDTAYWALELDVPTTVEVKASSPVLAETAPVWSIIELSFAARGKLPAVKVMWYDGGKQPPADLFHGEPIPGNGSLIIGSKGTVFTRTWHGGENKDDMFLLLPKKTFADVTLPPVSLPRVSEHHVEWLEACKGIGKTESSFGYASRLAETMLLGNVALHAGRKIDWQAESMAVAGMPEAEQWIKPQYRAGWSV